MHQIKKWYIKHHGNYFDVGVTSYMKIYDVSNTGYNNKSRLDVIETNRNNFNTKHLNLLDDFLYFYDLADLVKSVSSI